MPAYVCAQLPQSCLTHYHLWTVDRQTPLSMRLSMQEYWSELLCPPPGDLPNPGIKSASLASPALVGGFFTPGTTREQGVIFLKIFIYLAVCGLGYSTRNLCPYLQDLCCDVRYLFSCGM